MSQRLTRKDIKRDEFASAVGRGVDYAETHTRELLLSIGGVLLAVAIGLVAYFYVSHRSDLANQALAAAVKVYGAPIDATGAKPNDAAEPSFASDAARQARARRLLEQVRSDYRWTDAADIASLYLADLDAGSGKVASARKRWSDFVKKHGNHVLAVQSRIDLLELDRSQGKGQQVAQQLREMLDRSDAPLPQDVTLYQLAITLEQLNRDQEATQTYQRLVEEFPQSPYRQTAQQKLTALDPTRAAAANGQLAGLGVPPS
ncbi:MAG TPA: tetratricopeptide repeat protein [Thermoanaerobaculia bacterium]|nr:tetratricopeptide repeat protein [Thermoanaerobaculia bacterium]